MVFRLLILGWLGIAAASAGAADLSDRRAEVRGALEDAERGRLDPRAAARLADHPLYPWIEYAGLRRDFNTLSAPRVRAFLTRHGGQPVAALLREQWLSELARRKDWSNFRAFHVGADGDPLRCADLAARLATGAADAAWVADGVALYREAGRSLPGDCDAPIAALDARGALTSEARWARFDAAAEAGQTGIMRTAAKGLPAAERALAEDYAAFVDAPHDRAKAWPRTERSARIAGYGLARLARRDPGATEVRLAALAPALQLTQEIQGQVRYQIALWSVASYLPGSAARLNAVPDSAYDERLHEWRVREALARGDDAAALAAIAKMAEPQRSDARWKYFEARLLERAGRRDAARAAYAQAATSAGFHGFLAADRLNQAYALCPWQPNDPAPLRAEVADDPALTRALELFALDRIGWATREWNAALERFDDAWRRTAVELAQEVHWYDRAVFALGKQPDELRLYELRFPMHHTRTLRAEAKKNGLDPAFVAAEIRAESAWMRKARSSANALGLMQLIPSTAAATARRAGIPYRGAGDLFDSQTNIALGTAHLRYEIGKQGAPYLAIAAYNAGPSPVARWLSQRPRHDPDFWIETVTYKETRDYVARVLAFSVIYDWRLNGDAVPLTERMLGRGGAGNARKAFVCPITTEQPAS